MSDPSPVPPLPRHPPSVDPATPPIRGGQVAIGIVAAIVGHLLTIALAIADPRAGLLAQVPLLVVCLVSGIVLLSRRGGYRGLGLGLLIGWGVGVLVLPIVGIGLCINALNSSG
jgi:hypothetical protein